MMLLLMSFHNINLKLVDGHLIYRLRWRSLKATKFGN